MDWKNHLVKDRCEMAARCTHDKPARGTFPDAFVPTLFVGAGSYCA